MTVTKSTVDRYTDEVLSESISADVTANVETSSDVTTEAVVSPGFTDVFPEVSDTVVILSCEPLQGDRHPIIVMWEDLQREANNFLALAAHKS